jgi:hypothetical protein
MDLRAAFPIEDPPVSVPWGATEEQLVQLLASASPRRVTRGYVTLPVQVLGGLNCMLGFHFRDSGRLSELEFFRTAYPDQQASFDEFQRYFEQALGPPSRTEAGDQGFPLHEWRLPGARVVHYVFDRFGPEEHMRIQRVA